MSPTLSDDAPAPTPAPRVAAMLSAMLLGAAVGVGLAAWRGAPSGVFAPTHRTSSTTSSRVASFSATHTPPSSAHSRQATLSIGSAPQRRHIGQPVPEPARPTPSSSAHWLGPAILSAFLLAAAALLRPPRAPLAMATAAGSPETAAEPPRDDDVLPESLPEAILEASRATANAFGSGYQRCVVEVLVDGFWDPVSGPVFNDDGDNERWWQLNRKFIDGLIDAGRFDRVHVFLPDMGVVAMLRRMWPDARFTMASLEERGSLDKLPTGTELLVFAAPDPQSATGLQRIVNALPENVCVALFNPRLASGDVGIGLNIRMLREQFLAQFVTSYSIRPIPGIGAIFKAYPDPWKLFVNEPEREGRYRLVAETEARPAGDDLDIMLRDAFAPRDEMGNVKDPSLLEQVVMTLSSLTSFMRKL